MPMNAINTRSAVLAAIVVIRHALDRRLGTSGAATRADTGVAESHHDREGERQPVCHHRLERRQYRDLQRRQHRRVRHRPGVVLVDTKLPGWGQPILDRIKTVTDKPITTIINTHTHDDHTGSNDFFGASVETIVHENTRTNMTRMDAFKGAKATVRAEENLQRQIVARQRQGSGRPPLLRCRPYQRRYVRGVPGASRHAHRRHVRVESAPLHRHVQRRQRRRPCRDARQSGLDDSRTSTPSSPAIHRC